MGVRTHISFGSSTVVTVEDPLQVHFNLPVPSSEAFILFIL